jgi:hypothetical protein
VPKPPRPVVDDEPSATMTSVCPGRSFALVKGRRLPSDSPYLKVKQAAEGLKAPLWFCARAVRQSGSAKQSANVIRRAKLRPVLMSADSRSD